MKAKKDNKVYRIDETQKKKYLSEGFDIYNDEGELVEYSPLKKIEYNKYVDVLKENEELKKQLSELQPKKPANEKSLSKMNKSELTAKALELGIEITDEMTNDVIIGLIKDLG